MREKPDFELIAECRLGDDAAMAELFRRYYPACLRLARGILRCDEESQDAVQSAYFSAFRHIHNFRGDATFKTWISRIVMNQCLMVLREPRHRVSFVSLDDPDRPAASIMPISPGPTPEKYVLSQEVAAAVSDAIGHLPKPMREVFTLCAVSGYSAKEAAESLGLTVAATKTRLFRAHVQVRSRLKPMFPLAA